uniref:Uncharacterized protein n=1 Tax=Aegilops tauschii subsp. strangulata TaxID=200361 RepID=A0A453T684_AEGTS
DDADTGLRQHALLMRMGAEEDGSQNHEASCQILSLYWVAISGWTPCQLFINCGHCKMSWLSQYICLPYLVCNNVEW